MILLPVFIAGFDVSKFRSLILFITFPVWFNLSIVVDVIFSIFFFTLEFRLLSLGNVHSITMWGSEMPG